MLLEMTLWSEVIQVSDMKWRNPKNVKQMMNQSTQLILSFTIRNYLFLCHSLLHSVLQQPSPCRLEQISVLGCYCSTRFSCLSQCCSKKMEYLHGKPGTYCANTCFTSSWVMHCIGETNLWADTSWNREWELQYLGTLRLQKLPKQCFVHTGSFGCPQFFTASSALSTTEDFRSSELCGKSLWQYYSNAAILLCFQQTVRAEWNGWN